MGMRSVHMQEGKKKERDRQTDKLGMSWEGFLLT